MKSPMYHLPGFWNHTNWADDKWAIYLERRRKQGPIGAWFEQLWHRILGRFMSLERWQQREYEQWPSKTGSYDPCEDHFNWLIGAGLLQVAADLRKSAQRRRPEFL